MKQTAFNFSQQENSLNLSTKGKDKLRQIAQYSEVYLINAPNGELITIGHGYQGEPNKLGEFYVE